MKQRKRWKPRLRYGREKTSFFCVLSVIQIAD